jgi:hypothetical protein
MLEEDTSFQIREKGLPHSSGMSTYFHWFPLPPNTQRGIAGARWTLCSQWTCIPGKRRWAWGPCVYNKGSASLLFVLEENATSSPNTAHCKHNPDKWLGRRAGPLSLTYSARMLRSMADWFLPTHVLVRMIVFPCWPGYTLLFYF